MARFLLAIVAALLFLSRALPVLADSPSLHTVAQGETLYGIARSHGVAPSAIARANGIDVDSWVYIGQKLLIPTEDSGAALAPPDALSGDYEDSAGVSLFSIATRLGIGAESLATANDLPSSGVNYVGWLLRLSAMRDTAAAPDADPASMSMRIHIVRSGEQLDRIALAYGTTVQAITLANNLSNGWLVYAGQRLAIPTDEEQKPAPLQVVSTNIRVPDIPLYRQEQTLTCEEASVAMATRGRVSESRLVAAMLRSDNPFVGIRGNTNARNYGGLSDYGAYAQAVQNGLNILGVKSEVLYGQSYEHFKEDILRHLRAGHPVVWWHTWRDTYQVPVKVELSNGTVVKLVPYEHAGVIVGAHERGLTYNDPDDATVRFVSWADHRRVSGYFDNMGLVVY